MNINKALNSLGQASRLAKSAKQLGGFGGVSGLAGLGLAPAMLDGLGSNALATGFAPLTAKGLGEALGGMGGAGGSFSAGAFGLGSAGLGLLGQLTGDKGIAELGRTIGGIGQISTLVGPMASAAAAGNAVAFQAAAAAAAAAAPAAVVAAAIQMALTIAFGIQAGNPPAQIVLDTLSSPDFIASSVISHVVDPMFHPSEAYQTFAKRAGETAGSEGRALNALAQGLPYVQSQQELANAIGAFRNMVGQRVGGYGEGAGPLDIPALPELGARTHGMPTTPTNFGAITPDLQQLINALNQQLPATYAGQAGDDPLMRSFTQFLDRRGTGDYAGAAPIEFFTNEPYLNLDTINAQRPYTNQLYLRGGPAFNSSQEYTPQTLQYGDPGYDYAAAGIPEPGQRLGTISPAWQQLMGLVARG